MPVQPYRYVVCSPILHPVAARTGDVLIVRPGHPTHPIVVIRRVAGAWEPVRIGPPNYGALLVQEDEGAITPLLRSAPSLAADPFVRSA